MNIILKNTHIKDNIDIIKARDYYFNIAKKLNLAKSVIVFTPPILLSLSYLFELKFNIIFWRDYFDLFIGILTVISMVAIYIIDNYIEKFCKTSNALRAYYDHKVLGTKYNSLLYQIEDFEKYINKSKKIEYNSKYEVWYSEVFSDNNYANIFCCQLDNLLYAKHAYAKAKGFYILLLSVFSVFVICEISISLILDKTMSAFLIVFSVIECYDAFFNKINKTKDALAICTAFCDYSEKLSLKDLDENIIEKTQEIVSQNRNLCIFLPRIIRNKFLEDDNPFYRELNKYKSRFMGELATIPEKAEDIDVVFEDGSDAIPLSEIQARLRILMRKVISVLDKTGIEYTLDGGTLIGAMRTSLQGFIPWDDDIDIAIPIEQIEKAKKALQNSIDFVIQDAENEPFYSPRLAAFKIRETNAQSMISEKDSCLCAKYKNKGIFIDVYAFSPILISRTVDSIFRRLIIHPLNKKIKYTESFCFSKKNSKKYYKKFSKLKKWYLRVLSFYKKTAKNTEYYAYFPGYIHTHSKAGPYHLSNTLYGEKTCYAVWEEQKYKVPTDSNEILREYYGDDWETPLFCGKKELVEKYGDGWYSKAPCKISALKHIANVISFNR